ncbi:hypothetical protein SUGI_0182170 [Cryptomeria japonica]|nr:hypothetical protein SUGI_0182170 [Cryptomeria japonica]
MFYEAELARGDLGMYLPAWVYENYIKRAMVDDRDVVNVVPLSLLQRMVYAKTNITSSQNTLRGYEKLKATTNGKITLPITLGPKTISTKFYVIDRILTITSS